MSEIDSEDGERGRGVDLSNNVTGRCRPEDSARVSNTADEDEEPLSMSEIRSALQDLKSDLKRDILDEIENDNRRNVDDVNDPAFFGGTSPIRQTPR